jgi:hypothetical protein
MGEQYFSDKPNHLSFGLEKGYWAWEKGKFKPFPFTPYPLPEKYCMGEEWKWGSKKKLHIA